MTTVSDASALIERGSVDEARQLLEEHLASHPMDGAAAHLLGVCLFRKEQFDDAFGMFTKAIALRPDSPTTTYYLGLACERLGKESEALVYFEKTLSIDPGYELAKEKLAAAGVVISPPPPPRIEPPRPSVSSSLPLQTPAQGAGADQQLKDPGEVVYNGKRRMRSFSGHAVFTSVAVAFALWMWLQVASDPDFTPPSVALWFSLIAAAAWIALAVRSAATDYVFHERRIDFAKGVFYRKRISMWLYHVQDTWLTRSPLNLLTGDAKVHVRAPGLEAPTRRGSRKGAGKFMITGLGNHESMKQLWAELRDAALVERRGMKNWFV